MKISKTNITLYELDRDLRDYTIGEISDYCNSHSYCGNCIFKFLCELADGTERSMVEPNVWKDNAVRFQESAEFQAVLEENYDEDR